MLVQRDTYFYVPKGRLKLREQEGDTAHLIAYERPDEIAPRESRYRIVAVADPEGIKAALSAALGVRTVVAKERRLFLWKSVRIHLDQVEGLGSFIEFEAVAPPDSDLLREQGQVEFLRETFEIDERDLIAASYSDLALSSTGAEEATGGQAGSVFPEA